MGLEDDCKHLMYCREKITDYRKMETEARLRIVEYLSNHGQEGVVFTHKNKKVTLMVDSKHPKKPISAKEKEKKIHDILAEIGTIPNVYDTTQQIIKGMSRVSLVDKPSKLKLTVHQQSKT